MTRASIETSVYTLFKRALRSLVVGNPFVPTHPNSEFPTPLFRLFLITVSWLQLGIYFFSTFGGVTVWVLARYRGWDDPLKEYPLLSVVLEGWFILGFGLGLLILIVSHRWAVRAGVEWGWMGIRLGLIVFLVIFGSYLGGLIQQDIHISLITSVCLVIPAMLFWKLGTKTIRTITSLTPQDFQQSPEHRILDKHVIFLSYRREDSQAWTDRISDSLKDYYGQNAVFQDVEDIPPGVDFRDHLQAALENCRAILVVIGPNWLSAKDAAGDQRLWKDEDWVRLEIGMALGRTIPTIPLLVDKAKMPLHNELPDSIKEFAFQNGLPIRGNPDFSGDMEKLTRTLNPYVEE